MKAIGMLVGLGALVAGGIALAASKSKSAAPSGPLPSQPPAPQSPATVGANVAAISGGNEALHYIVYYEWMNNGRWAQWRAYDSVPVSAADNFGYMARVGGLPGGRWFFAWDYNYATAEWTSFGPAEAPAVG